jgi:DNA-binding transcriptional ArsR family regulator
VYGERHVPSHGLKHPEKDRLTHSLYFHNTGNMKTENAIKALAALAQGTRLEIYRLLVQEGPEGLAASVVAAKLDLPNATLSFHMKELSQAGLVSARQDGRFIYYSANYPAMNALVGYLTENCCGGEDCGIVCEPVKTSRRKSA